MYQGSCLCVGIHYEVHGDIGELSVCHCKNCQKVNGSAFLVAAKIHPMYTFTMMKKQAGYVFVTMHQNIAKG